MKTRLRPPHPINPEQVKYFFFGNDPRGLVDFVKSKQNDLTPSEFTLLAEDAFLRGCSYGGMNFVKELLRDPVVLNNVPLSFDNEKMRPIEMAFAYHQPEIALYLSEHKKFKGYLDLFFAGPSLAARLTIALDNIDINYHTVLKLIQNLLKNEKIPTQPPEDTACLLLALLRKNEKKLCSDFLKTQPAEEVLRQIFQNVISAEYHVSRQNEKIKDAKRDLLLIYQAVPQDAQASFF